MQQTFDSFLPTCGSRRALTITRDLLTSRSGGPRLVVLHGPPGVGKTHMIRAACVEAHPRESARATTAYDLVREIAGARTAAPGGLLAVDDLHTLVGLPMSQQETARLLEDRVRAGHIVLAAAGVPLAALDSLVGRLQRIDRAEFVEMTPPSLREMKRLLLVLAARESIELEDAHAGRIAVRCGGDVRLAQGAIARRRLLESIRASASVVGG